MPTVLNKDDLVTELGRSGAMTSVELQKHFGVSQPKISRLLASLEDALIFMGAARSSRYALAEPIGNHPAQQPIFLIDAQGLPHRLGTLSFLAKSHIHIGGEGVDMLFEPLRDKQLPWFLSGLKAEGFLGRILAKKLANEDIDSNPERWDARASLTPKTRLARYSWAMMPPKALYPSFRTGNLAQCWTLPPWTWPARYQQGHLWVANSPSFWRFMSQVMH
jgi:hypothetical protein